MVLNSLAAMAAAVLNGVDPEAAAEGLRSFESLQGRGKIAEAHGITVINDAYNAAPQSMIAGLKVLNGLPAKGRHIAVLADMLELGPEEERYHREVGEAVVRETPNVSEVWLYGTLSKRIAEGIRAAEGSSVKLSIRCFDDRERLGEELKNYLQPGDAVLFKGSNSMKLSLVADLITGKEE